MSIENFRYQLQSLKKCNQYWDEMKPVPGGRLCAQCDRRIVDFSKMTYTEMVLYRAENQGPVCGFYLPEQLPSAQKKTISMVWSISSALLGLSTANGMAPLTKDLPRS